jgi:membrane protein DedA with SNARE-associated domain
VGRIRRKRKGFLILHKTPNITPPIFTPLGCKNGCKYGLLCTPGGAQGVVCFWGLFYSLEMKSKKRVYLEFFIVLTLVLGWIAFLCFFSPKDILSVIGIGTGYLLIFLTALFAVSGLASAPFYTTFITFASTGEFNFFLVLLVSVPALTLGDSIFFLVGHKGHFVASGFLGKKIDSFSRWIKSKPKLVVPVFAYLYTAITPLPQDILMTVLGLGKTNFKQVFTAVLLGNATFLTIIYLFSKFIFPDIFS